MEDRRARIEDSRLPSSNPPSAQPMHRRAFLQTAGASVGLAALGAAACRTTAPSAPVPRRLGVQLYTLRGVLAEDFVGVLEAVGGIGYEEVEFAGYHGREPGEIRTVLDDLGLAAPAAHVGLDALRADLDGQVEAAHALGHRYLVVPWLDAQERASLDGYRRIADELNAIGVRTREAGVQLAYHNHDFEFETFGSDRSGYDALLEETDPVLVAMEMDLYWTVNGGRDPVDYFERHPGRFPLLHLKDRTAAGEMVDVGAGAIDFARVFEHAEEAGVRHAFVEHDEPGDALGSVRASHGYLVRLRGS
jgi:sugar phosphate isomerase/epimerase